MNNISIVIPAKDEEANLHKLLNDLYDTLPKLEDKYKFEVICVDDHSIDKTADIARSFGATVVQNRKRAGKGMALRAGFQQAKGDIFVMMDADYSHRPEELPVFLDAFQDDVGLVTGSRVFGGSEEYTSIRALGNVFLTAGMGLCIGRYLSDVLNGYKAFRRDVYTDFKYTAKEFEIEIEIVANSLRKGYRIIEVISHERARAGGQAKSKIIRHGTRFLLRILWERYKGIHPHTENKK